MSFIRKRRNRAVMACAALMLLLAVDAQAQTANVVTVWKVGSPHREVVPAANIPPALAREAARQGLRLHVEAFPAAGFAARFFEAARRGTAPDVIAFDNMGVLNGITTELGTFTGIGQDTSVRRNLIQVAGAFDELLHPQRGWTFLLTSSPNHKAARALALRPPACLNRPNEAERSDVAELAVDIVTAYLKGDFGPIQHHLDPERLAGFESRQKPVRVGSVRSCGVWGNDRLRFAWVNASYEGTGVVGQSPVLLIFRKPASTWQLLAVARDPVSNGVFVNQVPVMADRLAQEPIGGRPSEPAVLLSPADGAFPQPAAGQRFGDFTWRPSPSADVIAQIAEFAYHDDARFFLLPKAPIGHVSAGQLWTIQGPWMWRVWSITRAGEVVFSETRTFTH